MVSVLAKFQLGYSIWLISTPEIVLKQKHRLDVSTLLSFNHLQTKSPIRNEKSLNAINGQGINLSEKYALMAYGGSLKSNSLFFVYKQNTCIYASLVQKKPLVQKTELRKG